MSFANVSYSLSVCFRPWSNEKLTRSLNSISIKTLYLSLAGRLYKSWKAAKQAESFQSSANLWLSNPCALWFCVESWEYNAYSTYSAQKNLEIASWVYHSHLIYIKTWGRRPCISPVCISYIIFMGIFWVYTQIAFENHVSVSAWLKYVKWKNIITNGNKIIQTSFNSFCLSLTPSLIPIWKIMRWWSSSIRLWKLIYKVRDDLHVILHSKSA